MVVHSRRLNGPESAVNNPGSEGDRRQATQMIVHANSGHRLRYTSGGFGKFNRGKKGW